jgi:hypothetical protein
LSIIAIPRGLRFTSTMELSLKMRNLRSRPGRNRSLL